MRTWNGRGWTWLVLAVVAVATGAAALQGTDRVWIGGTGDWDNPDNWDPAGIPGTETTDSATINDGGVALGTAYTIGALSLNPGGGDATLEAGEELTVSGPVEIAGGTYTGTGDLVADAVVMTGGAITEGASVCCNVIAESSLELSGSATKTLARGVVNRGEATWSGGDVDLTGGRFTNEAGATFTATHDTDASLTGGVFENAGSWVHGADACCNIVMETDFTNTGTVDVQSSVMNLNVCCTFTQTDGVTAVSEGAALALGGDATFSGGEVSGAGTLAVTGGAVTAEGAAAYAPGRTEVSSGSLELATDDPVQLGGLDVAGGTVTGAVDLTVDEGRLTGGILWAEDCCSIVATSTLELAGAQTKTLRGSVANRGEATWSGGDVDLTDGQLTNEAGGTFTVGGTDAEVSLTGGAVENAGSWVHGANICCEIVMETDFTNAGTVDLQGSTMGIDVCCTFRQTEGATTVAEGATLSGEVSLEGGTLAGDGAVEGSVTSSGVVGPGASTGVLTVEGEYAQTADGTLEVEIEGPDPGTGHDRLAVTGTAALDGTLRVARAPDFEPELGAEFTVLTWGSRDGEFAALEADSAGPGRVFEARYGEGGLALAAVATEGPRLEAMGGGSAPPASSSASPGEADVPVLQAALSAEADHALVESVTLEASGTGDDAADLERVALVADEDGDGAAGEGEPVLAAGSYGADDGPLELALEGPLRVAVGEEVAVLVTYDVAPTLAHVPLRRDLRRAGLPLAAVGLVGLSLWAARRRRVDPAALGLLLLAAASLLPLGCGGGGEGGTPSEPEPSRTYAVEMTAVSATGETGGEAGSVSGLPVEGTELTVNP